MVGRLKLLLLCAGDNQYHDHPAIGRHLEKILSPAEFEVTLSDDFNRLKPGSIRAFDAVALYAVHAQTSKENIDGLLAAVKGDIPNYRGRSVGFTGIHGATICFDGHAGYREMIGATFISHPEFGPVYQFNIKNKSHFITHDVNDFELRDELYLFKIHSDFQTMVSCDYEKAERPVAWIKPYGKGRVFYIALGHGTGQLDDINIQTLLINGIKWAALGE